MAMFLFELDFFILYVVHSGKWISKRSKTYLSENSIKQCTEIFQYIHCEKVTGV